MKLLLFRFLGREFIAMFNVFFLFPLLIVFVLISVINGVIWNVLLGIAFTCLVFLIFIWDINPFYKKMGEEHCKQMQKRIEANTLLLNNKFILYCNNFFICSAIIGVRWISELTLLILILLVFTSNIYKQFRGVGWDLGYDKRCCKDWTRFYKCI